MSPLLAFALGVAAYWLYEHFMPSPKANMGKYKGAGGLG
jgi:hypothetical protein